MMNVKPVCFFGCAISGIALTAMIFLSDPSILDAAVISWGPVFTIDDPSDISKPPGSSHVAAIDFNTPTGMATPEGDNIINGIVFSGSFQPQTYVSHSFTSGPIYDPTLYPNSTGDQDLDDLLDSYAYREGDPRAAGFSILTTDAGEYQIQVIGIADPRPCCSGYTYEMDNGASNFESGVQLQRGLPKSVIGTFTKDFGSQPVQLRSLNFLPGNPDPGIAGLIVRRLNAVAEPTSIALIGVAGAAWLVARCRRRGRSYPR